MASYFVNSEDPNLQDLVDQLNGTNKAYSIGPNGALPNGALPFSTATRTTAAALIVHQADSSGKFGPGVVIPRDLPSGLPTSLTLYTGLTTTALPPSTTDLPSNGSWGWHKNTANGWYYWAYNDAGTIITPTVQQTAIILQTEANNLNGGSAQGYQSAGADTSSVANHFYARRLTDIVVNEGSFVTFTAASGAAPNHGEFTLPAGTYHITIHLTYYLDDPDTCVVWGIADASTGTTNPVFEVYEGGSIPITGNVGFSSAFGQRNQQYSLEAVFTIASAKTYVILHQCTSQVAAREVHFQGQRYTSNVDQVNGAAPLQQFAIVKIIKTA